MRLRNNCFHSYATFADDGVTTKTHAEFIALARCDASGDLDATDPKLSDPGAGDFSLQDDSPCKWTGHGSGVVEGVNGVAFDAHHPDIGAWSGGKLDCPERSSATVAGVDGGEITVSLEGAPYTEHRADLFLARTGELDDHSLRTGPGNVTLTASELSARYFVVASSRNPSGRSLPSAPQEIFVSEGAGHFEELRAGLVSRLAAHAGLAEILGTDESGAVPIYASRPASPRRVPSIVYELGDVPDRALDRPGRWIVRLEIESWGGSPGVNDAVISAADEVLNASPFEGTNWAVKRIHRTGDGTRWEDDGRTEVRRTTWSVVVDRIGS